MSAANEQNIILPREYRIHIFKPTCNYTLFKCKEYLGIILLFSCSIFIFSRQKHAVFSLNKGKKLVCRSLKTSPFWKKIIGGKWSRDREMITWSIKYYEYKSSKWRNGGLGRADDFQDFNSRWPTQQRKPNSKMDGFQPQKGLMVLGGKQEGWRKGTYRRTKLKNTKAKGNSGWKINPTCCQERANPPNRRKQSRQQKVKMLRKMNAKRPRGKRNGKAKT